MRKERFYFLMVALLLTGCTLALGCQSATEPTTTPARLQDEPFLDTLQARTFQWFWDKANPDNGLVPDRWPTRTFSSVAAIGFGLTALPVGVERGYVTRQEAIARTLTTLRFLWEAPQGVDSVEVTGHRGFFYHFLDMETGYRYRTVELSTIDTGLLMAGVLFCQSYFQGSSGDEAAIRAYADSLYRRVEWTWFLTEEPLITMAWHPEQGGEYGRARYQGYNEAMILYVLALGSPTHPIPPETWEVYTRTYQWDTYYGQEHLQFSPLFGHQYSHVWIDFRGIQDAYMRGKGIDYFENSRRATYSQQAYAIDNPEGWTGYDADLWGLTASDGPVSLKREVNGKERQFHTYWARGASARHVNDDGTLVPTAVGGSIPFAPEITIPTLKAMVARYGDDLFTEYGFVDAFNPTFTFTDVELRHGRVVPGKAWFDTDYLGIDQGPIVTMAENYRSGLIWEVMKQNPYMVRGLCRAGFRKGWLEGRCEE